MNICCTRMLHNYIGLYFGEQNVEVMVKSRLRQTITNGFEEAKKLPRLFIMHKDNFYNVCTTNFKKIAHLTFKIKYLFSSNKVLKRKMAPMKLTFQNKLDSNDKEKIWYNDSCTLILH